MNLAEKGRQYYNSIIKLPHNPTWIGFLENLMIRIEALERFEERSEKRIEILEENKRKKNPKIQASKLMPEGFIRIVDWNKNEARKRLISRDALCNKISANPDFKKLCDRLNRFYIINPSSVWELILKNKEGMHAVIKKRQKKMIKEGAWKNFMENIEEKNEHKVL